VLERAGNLAHMSAVRALRRLSIWAGVLSVLVTAPAASAHVAFLAPPPVENENDPNAPKTPPKVLKFGSKYKLVWEVQILHDPEDFDIDLLETKDGTPTTIVHGLSPETLEYEWTVPEMACTGCLIRLTQNNTINDDYTGFAPVTLSATGGSTSDPEPGGAGKGGSDAEPGGAGKGGSDAESGSTSHPAEPEAEDDGGCSSSGRPAPAGGGAFALVAAAALARARRRSQGVTR
jgi:MYXO-CTERM domain-containing protein